MGNINFTFLNKFEEKIFNQNENTGTNSYFSLTLLVLLSSLVVAISTAVLLITSQYFNIIQYTGNIIVPVVVGLGLLFVIVKTYSAFQRLSSVGMKIGMVLYALVLYFISFGVFYKFIVWIIIAAIILFVIWLMFKYVFNSKP